jgi:hypothetical protein
VCVCVCVCVVNYVEQNQIVTDHNINSASDKYISNIILIRLSRLA